MDDNKDVRYIQRMQNLKQILNHLGHSLQIENPDLTQKAGLIQFFEIAFELSWKLLKDYLEEEGFENINSPRSAIKFGMQIKLIDDGRIWLEMLNDRNETTHLYSVERINQIEGSIRNKYYKNMLLVCNAIENRPTA